MTRGVPVPGYTPKKLARLLGLPPPTPEQAAVIGAPLEPMVVIAGAGSGKSETMAARLVWLVANGLVRPERVLGLTFTRKAAAELGQRVRVRLDGLRRVGIKVAAPTDPPPGAGPEPAPGPADDAASQDPLLGEPVVSTYHAYAARLVADHALREALEPTLRLITPAIAWQLAARVVASYGGPVDAVPWTPTGATAAVLTLAGELAEHLRSPDDVREVGEWLRAAAGRLDGRVPAAVTKVLECQRTREQLLPMVAAYGRAKADRELIDYGDQVALAARIASKHPEVGEAERSRFQVVLLDEYQDTSHAQLVLLQALFGGGHPVTAVGDPCQSIYGWRGASAGNLLRFRQDFPALSARPGQPGPPVASRAVSGGSSRRVASGESRRRGADCGRAPQPTSRAAALAVLSTSFRNCERVLDAAAVVQQDLREQAREVPRLQPHEDRRGRGAVRCALLDTATAEAEWVAERISELLRLPAGVAPDGDPWPAGGSRRVRPADIAVLCRKRSQFPALRAAMEARGIPVEVVGLGGLLTVPEIADVVATLRVLHDPTASSSLARILTGSRWRIGPGDLIALGRRARELARDHEEAERAARRAAAADALGQAVADLTADPGSLVEALDDLGDRAAYSAVGYERFTALARELRSLRAQAGRPLPDLISEVERVLGLNIEVAAQPWRDPATARADLDAFATAAADFADGDEAPTLGAFLAYLSAAEDEEFGLEAGRRAETDAVTLTTIHAAKGLEWPAVFVAGLSDGVKAHVFPARPRMTTRWTENPRLLPFPLRGDAGDLPRLPDLAPASLEAFRAECAERELSEERRLAYVAITRAAFWVASTGYWWGDGVSSLGPSVFLEEVRAACEAGAGTVCEWAPEPAHGAENPALSESPARPWPLSPSGPRHEAITEAAALVEQALGKRRADSAEPGAAGRAAPGAPSRRTRRGEPAQPGASAPGERSAASPRAGRAAGQTGSRAITERSAASAQRAQPAQPPGPSGFPAIAGLRAADRQRAEAWANDTDLLLAELADWRGANALAVPLPGRLSVSSLVAIAADPGEFAQRIRRPMPRPPAPQARRGTAFHRWLEQRFGQQRLLEPADLLGAADESGDEDEAADLALLRERFEAGEWGNRWPLDVEVPFETVIDGWPVRGRIDAVFADGDGGYDVVDWKTGKLPATEEQRAAVAVQLAAYRLAWSRLTALPLARVRAAFYYVRQDRTVRPADLLDEDGLTALIQQLPEAGQSR